VPDQGCQILADNSDQARPIALRRWSGLRRRCPRRSRAHDRGYSDNSGYEWLEHGFTCFASDCSTLNCCLMYRAGRRDSILATGTLPQPLRQDLNLRGGSAGRLGFKGLPELLERKGFDPEFLQTHLGEKVYGTLMGIRVNK
jgi:hypothetical protein